MSKKLTFLFVLALCVYHEMQSASFFQSVFSSRSKSPVLVDPRVGAPFPVAVTVFETLVPHSSEPLAPSISSVVCCGKVVYDAAHLTVLVESFERRKLSRSGGNFIIKPQAVVYTSPDIVEFPVAVEVHEVTSPNVGDVFHPNMSVITKMITLGSGAELEALIQEQVAIVGRREILIKKASMVKIV